MREAERFVVDASVAIKWVLPEEGSLRALQLLESGAELIAPEFCLVEVAAVIGKQARRPNPLSPEAAREALAIILETPLELLPSDDLLEQAFELGLTFRHALYDCIYVALALRERCTLITADGPLARTFGPATGHVVHLDRVGVEA